MALYEISYEFPLGTGKVVRRNVTASTEEEARRVAGVINPTLTAVLSTAPIFVSSSKRVASYRRVDTIGNHNFGEGTVDVCYIESPELFYVLGIWASGGLKMDLEANADSDEKAREMYRSLSGGAEPVAYRGNANKWGVEAALHFSLDYDLPECLAEHQVERPGLISRVQLFNMLVGMGFRAGEPHDITKIEAVIPTQYLEFFKRGLVRTEPALSMF